MVCNNYESNDKWNCVVGSERANEIQQQSVRPQETNKEATSNQSLKKA